LAEELLLLQKEENICTITINRPHKRNSLTPELLLQMGYTFNALKEDGDIRAVIIRGVGEECFSSGYDMGRITSSEAEKDTYSQQDPLSYAMSCIDNYPYPVIAMIYGYAMGAGLELAATCDLRFAADTARLGIPPAKLGILYNHSGILRLMNLVGISATKELLYTGRLCDAKTAKEIRLVDHVVPAQELASITYKLAREIAENAPLAVSGVKTTILKLMKCQTISPEDEAELHNLRSQALLSEDRKEGQRAFQEKRKPRFVGR